MVVDRVQRPTSDSKAVMLDRGDIVWDQLRTRLVGLDDAEYLWEPCAHVWTVRPSGDGQAVVDGAGERDLDPAPVTTIAWRIWHIAVDCLDSYSQRFLGRIGSRVTGDAWYLNADDAIADLTSAWVNFRDGMEQLDDVAWWQPIGADFGPYAQHSACDLTLHALTEVTHHGAEIALLRDLYRSR